MTCRSCNLNLELNQFRRHSRVCRNCVNQDQNRRYHLNKVRYRASSIARWGAAIAERVKYVLAIKAGPCTDCQQLFHPAAMDFDRRRGHDGPYSIYQDL